MPASLKPRVREDPFLGVTLNGRFKIESKLGEGGFGAVYKGTQVQTGRKVALKLLHPEMTRDENLVARFRREGLVLCNLRDPHTITTYDFDATPDGTLYIAMELLEGKSLHQVFHNEAPIAWARVLKIVSQMCSSLGEAHKQNIVHRDLKPENIYLEDRGGDPEFVKILDFGIAKVMRGDNSVDPQAPQLTATGQTLGTLEYMSPEQLMGKQLDGRSDVYALGVLMYELLTGRLPFPEAKGPAALITAQLKQTPKPPSTVHPQGDIPPGVDRIVLKALEKDKNNRFQEVGALAHAATDCIASHGHWGADDGGTLKGPALGPAPGPQRPGGSAPNLAMPPQAAPPPQGAGASRSGGSSPNLRMPPQQAPQRSDGSAPHRLPGPPHGGMPPAAGRMPSPSPGAMAPARSDGSAPHRMPAPPHGGMATPPPGAMAMHPGDRSSPFARDGGSGPMAMPPAGPHASDPRLAPMHAGASGPMHYPTPAPGTMPGPMGRGRGPGMAMQRGLAPYATPARSRLAIWVTVGVLVAAGVAGAILGLTW
jgi:serine/threonine-protein kinase